MGPNPELAKVREALSGARYQHGLAAAGEARCIADCEAIAANLAALEDSFEAQGDRQKHLRTQLQMAARLTEARAEGVTAFEAEEAALTELDTAHGATRAAKAVVDEARGQGRAPEDILPLESHVEHCAKVAAGCEEEAAAASVATASAVRAINSAIHNVESAGKLPDAKRMLDERRAFLDGLKAQLKNSQTVIDATTEDLNQLETEYTALRNAVGQTTPEGDATEDPAVTPEATTSVVESADPSTPPVAETSATEG